MNIVIQSMLIGITLNAFNNNNAHFRLCVTLTSKFSVDHDVQVLLWVSTDVSGDGVQADGGIVQRETHPRAIKPRQAPERKKTHQADR